MQIFTPYANPIKTAKYLDNRRLNKQILECIQIISANTGIDVGWKIPKYVKNHPVTVMWKDDSGYLVDYLFELEREFFNRKKGYHKTFMIWVDLCEDLFEDYSIPKHLTPEFCKFHQKKLYEKDPVYYKDFG